MTIEKILNKYDQNYIAKVVLNYSGQVEEFTNFWDIPEEIMEDEATCKLKNYILTIIVK